MNHIGEDSSISVVQKDGRSQKSSFQYISHAFIQRQITSIDHHFTSHVSGFCVVSLEVWPGSWSAHQAAHQGIQAGTTCAATNHDQVGSIPSFIGIGVSAAHPLESNNQWHHEKPYQQMDRQVCERGLYMSRQRPWRSGHSPWSQSVVSIMGIQLSSSSTWHTVSGILGVVRSLLELYLCDMARITEVMSTLGPIVVTQHILDPGHLPPPPLPTRSVCSHCYNVLNEDYLVISWYLHVRHRVAVARIPPTVPAKKRSLRRGRSARI